MVSAGASEAVGNAPYDTDRYQRTLWRRHVRSDSRPAFSLWTEIAVRTTTDTRRLSHAQRKVIVARKSLKSTGQHPRRPTSFTDFSFAIHLYGPGFGPETSFFTHQLEFVRHLQARRHASGSARTEEISPKESGLQTTPSVLQTASASPEADCFELRHFCWRGSVKTDSNAKWLGSSDVSSTYSEDCAVLLDICKGRGYSLNPVAARIWSTVEASPSGVDLVGLVDVMETHSTISREQLERDIDEYLSKLEHVGLVQPNGRFHAF